MNKESITTVDREQKSAERASQRHSQVPGLPLVEAGLHKSRATPETWSLIKADYLVGRGSLRALAARYSVSPSTTMKRAAREHWAASGRLNRSTTESKVAATMQQRAAEFVERMADQSDSFLAKVAESGELLQPSDRHGLKQLTSALKDVSAVGRDIFNLGSSDGQLHCLVNLSFLQDYVPVMTQLVETISTTNPHQ